MVPARCDELSERAELGYERVAGSTNKTVRTSVKQHSTAFRRTD